MEYFSGKFEKILGKSSSHSQEFALSCTCGTLHFLFPYRESLYKWLPDRESTWTVSPLLIPDFLSTTLLQVSLTGLARHNVVDQTSGAFPSSHFMWIASLRCHPLVFIQHRELVFIQHHHIFSAPSNRKA